jgi:hypothetical protein
MTLRYFAGGSYIDISLAYLVSVSTFCFVVHETVVDIDEVLRLNFRTKIQIAFTRLAQVLRAEIVRCPVAWELWME